MKIKVTSTVITLFILFWVVTVNTLISTTFTIFLLHKVIIREDSVIRIGSVETIPSSF